MSAEQKIEPELSIKFDTPPVVETVMDIQFEDVSGFSAPHLGDLWSEFGRDVFIDCENVPILPKLNAPPGISFFNRPEIPRVWFKDKSGNILLQFQADRFCYNWRKSNNQKNYPSYKSNLEKFKKYYDNLLSFLKKNASNVPKIEMLELRYINIIPLSTIGNLDQIGKLLNNFNWSFKANTMPIPKNINFSLRFEVPSIQAFHNFSLFSAQDIETGDEILRLDNSIRGRSPSHIFDPEIENWFNEAHKWLVNSFINMTTVEMQEQWCRQ